MNIGALVFCAVCFTLPASIASAEQICNDRDSSDTTNVRQGPSAKNYPAIDRLPNGTAVQVLERITNPEGFLYAKVRFSHLKSGTPTIGYVFNRLVADRCTIAASPSDRMTASKASSKDAEDTPKKSEGVHDGRQADAAPDKQPTLVDSRGDGLAPSAVTPQHISEGTQSQGIGSPTPAAPLFLDGKFIRPTPDGDDVIEFMGNNFCFNDLGCSQYERHENVILVVFPELFSESQVAHKIQVANNALVIRNSSFEGAYYKEASPELEEAISDRDAASRVAARREKAARKEQEQTARCYKLGGELNAAAKKGKYGWTPDPREEDNDFGGWQSILGKINDDAASKGCVCTVESNIFHGHSPYCRNAAK